MELADLKQIDSLTEASLGGCQCLLHRDHRWVLPIIYEAQERGVLSKPCTLVMFDAHHDGKRPACMHEISSLREEGVAFDSLVRLCRTKLSTNDDDWLQAGMELGLIRDAVVFGCLECPPVRLSGQIAESLDLPPSKFTDCGGEPHRIEVAKLPGRELRHQRRLGDSAKRSSNSDLWGILDWQFCEGRVGFAEDAKPILLDIDLDCFVAEWLDYKFPWPDEVFCGEFLTESNSHCAKGWNGKRFFDSLLGRAELVTIATEPSCCCGEANADRILGKLNYFLFDHKLEFP